MGVVVLLVGLLQVLSALPRVPMGPLSAGAAVAQTPTRMYAAAPAGDTLPRIPFYGIVLRRPGEVRGPGLGDVAVAFPDSPFNVAVSRRGHYVYDLQISAARLPSRAGVHHVAWVASSDLQEIRRVGTVARGKSLHTRVDFANKFLVFISAESSPDVEQPGRIVASGASRSGRMVGMFSHGLCPPDAVC